MAETTDGFDLEALLAPIEGDARAGADLRSDPSPRSLYYRLRDARSEARQIERDMDRDNQGQDSQVSGWPMQQWRAVRELAIEALGVAKDLEVAAWLTEALSRDGGLPGLTAGIQLMTGLVEGFWEDVHPLPDEEGIPTRVAPVAGLNGGPSGNGTLIQPLRRLPLFQRPNGEALEFWRFEQSERIAQAPSEEARQQRIAAGAIPFEALSEEALRAGGQHFARLRAAATGAAEAWRRMGKAFDERAGADSPSTKHVTDLLDKIVTIAKLFASMAPPSEPEPSLSEPVAADAAIDAPARAPGGAVTTREDALRGLLDIAEYFRRTEPLSPLAYTLQEAVRRGRMTWPQLLEEIVPDVGTRAVILTSLGIRPPSE